MNRLAAMRALVEIVDRGSLTAAARMRKQANRINAYSQDCQFDELIEAA